jgi:carbonic anhydrase/acetyltransferase-like protein (isoleucine patch superfamily)
MTHVPLEDSIPHIDSTAWVAPGAFVIGAVTLGPRSSIWYGAVLRADGDVIAIDAESNVQDGCVIHSDPGLPVRLGARVSVGHRAVLHGCTVEEDVLLGMGAIVLNGATIGSGSLVAAGTVVLEGTQVPPGSLIAGVPGKVRRAITTEERLHIRSNAEDYLAQTDRHRGTR